MRMEFAICCLHVRRDPGARTTPPGGTGAGVDHLFEGGVQAQLEVALAASDRPEELLLALRGYSGRKGTMNQPSTGSLRLPTLGIAGAEDGSTPPDLVRETVNLIPGSGFHLIRRAGHLPCVEQPVEYAKVLTDFMRKVGHV